MNNYLARYSVLVGTLVFLFGGFIACGTKIYQASLRGDVEEAPNQTTASNSDHFGIHAVNGWDKLPIAFRFGQDLSIEQQSYILKAMHSWELAVGKQIFSLIGTHKGVTGDTFPDLYSSLSDGVNGHYVDLDWEKTGKLPEVLATTIWNNKANNINFITDSDIRFNGKEYLLVDSLKTEATQNLEVVDLQSLALHEIGHLLGLAHMDESVDGLSVMNAYLFIGEGLTTRRLSKGDVERIQSIYGCHNDACDVEAVMQKLDEFDKQDSEPPQVETASQN